MENFEDIDLNQEIGRKNDSHKKGRNVKFETKETFIEKVTKYDYSQEETNPNLIYSNANFALSENVSRDTEK
jgi:hypothetical protein